MTIHLNSGDGNSNTKEAAFKMLEHDIIACKKGDWESKKKLAKSFQPLLLKLAEKRSSDTAEINHLIELGREGLYVAAKKYKPSMGASHFRVFALDYIDKSMNDAAEKHGILSKLFHKQT